MPRIFDNIDELFKPALIETIRLSERADFCVGYFNLRGWKEIDGEIDKWNGGLGSCCRLLVGMQSSAGDDIKRLYTLSKVEGVIDSREATVLRQKLADHFRIQLTFGLPTNSDEVGLQTLSRELKEKKVIVKLFLRHPLHAKLYLSYRDDYNNPITGYLGSSNLTLAGLLKQGELNVDILDQDACRKLEKWFEYRWTDKFCIDITDELAQIIDESWAGKDLIPPYYIYLKIAYHLAQEARAGLTDFKIPKEFRGKLFEFQEKAVQIAANHLNKRGGVIIGDVVGLGKTLMASALAKVCQEAVNYAWRTLIICPKNLVPMWERYNYDYNLNAKILSISMVQQELPDLRIYKLIIIDESHNLRNREGKRYRAIRDYISENDCKVIMLTATPYNKTFLDLSSQLRLFLPDDKDIRIKPEHYIRMIGEIEFNRRHQCSMKSISAFEFSSEIEDWRNLMRYYLVRRTRSFIMDIYAMTDNSNGRKYLEYPDKTRAYFPDRIPKTLTFTINENDPDDQYARLYTDIVVDMIDSLNLPRYGLANYLKRNVEKLASEPEKRIINNLTRAGKRLMGFCRTHLFKRLESSGDSFLKSVKNHILRNYLFIYALENNLEIPIGMLNFGFFDEQSNDDDVDSFLMSEPIEEYSYDDDQTLVSDVLKEEEIINSEQIFRNTAAELYSEISNTQRRRFSWLKAEFFEKSLLENIIEDSKKLLDLLKRAGEWDASTDTKLAKLRELINAKHPQEKILIFSQYADTIDYLHKQLKNYVPNIEKVTGDTDNPTNIAYRFSPQSNQYTLKQSESMIRVVLSTDILSEGQNLQDAYIVVNYDLPWTIIRLVQRVGRVDRIGQKSDKIWCYSFLPAEGIERILRLRARVRQRLRENGEVLGSDEMFFEDQNERQNLHDLYTENSNILEQEGDTEVDLASKAFEIWRKATENDPALKRKIETLENVVFSTRKHKPDKYPEGVIVYLRTSDDSDALAFVNKDGNVISESPSEILDLAECKPDTPAIKRHDKHHEIVEKSVNYIITEQKSIGGTLGRPSGARFKTYERLKNYIVELESKSSLMLTPELRKAVDEIYNYPLREGAKEILNRQLKTGITNQELADLVQSLRDEDKLTITPDEAREREPQIICSLGLFEITEDENGTRP